MINLLSQFPSRWASKSYSNSNNRHNSNHSPSSLHFPSLYHSNKASKTLNNLEDLIRITIEIDGKAEVALTKETAMDTYNSNIVVISTKTSRTTHNQAHHPFKHNNQNRNE
jgi:hypothetical protein